MTRFNFNQDIDVEVDNGILVSEGSRLLFKNPASVISGGTSTENKRGSDCSSTDGTQNRVLTLANTGLTSNELVFVNGLLLHSADYTISHLSSSTTITFINYLFDIDYIKIQYLEQ